MPNPVVNMDSPNQSERVHGQDGVRLVICHTPEGGWDGTIATIMNPNSDVSYHRLRSQNGLKAVQFVPWAKKAWHAKVYNSMSDGVAIEGHARHFDLEDWDGIDEFARDIAERLVARGLKPQWTTDGTKGGFCRHGDIQSDRSDPTPDLREWSIFVQLVQQKYEELTGHSKDWPVPIPKWFWAWAQWKLGEGKFKKYGPSKGPRPKNAPRLIPPGHWAWRRLRALLKARKV